MASIGDKFNGSKTKLLIGTAWADISAAVIGDIDSLISVAKVVDLGTISNEANVIDVPEFGQDYAGKLVGQLNAGTLDATLAWNPSDTQHDDLKTALTAKTKKGFAIRWFDGSYGTGANATEDGRDFYIEHLGTVTDWSPVGGSATAAVGDVFTATLTTADLDTTLTATGALAQEAAADYVVFNGYVASFGIETTIDDAVKATASVAIDGALKFLE